MAVWLKASLDAAAWLVTNYEVDIQYDGPLVTLDEVHNRSTEDFQKVNLLPPSKIALSKLVYTLFGLHNTSKRDTKTKYIVYPKLKARQHNGSQKEITVPEHCSIIKTPSSLTVECNREWLINGNVLTCSVMFSESDTQILVNRSECVTLGFVLEISQSNVDGMIVFLERLKFCQGLAHSDDFTDCHTEQWAMIHDEKLAEKRVKSESCQILVTFNNASDHCRLCFNYVRHKRINARQSVKIAKVKCTRTEEIKTEKHDQNDLSHEPLSTPSSTASPVSHTTTSEMSPSLHTQDESSTQSTDDMLDRLLKNCSPENFRTLIQTQLKNASVNKHRRRWDEEFLNFCLAIYCRSPSCYEDIRNFKMLIMPSKSTLHLYKNTVKQRASIKLENIIL